MLDGSHGEAEDVDAAHSCSPRHSSWQLRDHDADVDPSQRRHLEGGSVSRVANDLDLTETALRKWVQQAEIDEGRGAEGALTTEEKAEFQQLRRENRTLKMERDFLIEADAFFAKENDRPSS